ncbi:acyl-CoA dehydrogenase family protein [Micromonospora echinofusca]|uniref:Acyl-CoA dehydrogenase n=1 Tax=Micromonospora echinofusca TaxID=47858 RepID=A0ABS3VQV8_MICEH|nr:acyl-CoA dehydrogenase family protein [Micromonospora echinofusca]MBO4206764.1 acyl-CoA dehydrogenase [Micromonospora echinofusca]
MGNDQPAVIDRVRTRFGPVPVHPVLDRIAGVVGTTIAPAAPAVDASAVPAGHLAALADAGLFGLAVPAEHGGAPVPEEVATEAFELLAGACPATHLIASQHATPVGAILRSGKPELLALLPVLARGERYGGAAFGHVRTWPRRRTVTATQVPGGWRFDGTAPWFSGAGLVDLALVGAIDEARQRIVFAVVDVPRSVVDGDAPALRSRPLTMAAIDGARTVALDFGGLVVPDTRVTEVVDVAGWSAADGTTGARSHPGAVGLARAAVGFALERYPDSPGLHALADEIALIRTLADGPDSAADASAPGRSPLYWRARSVHLAVRATNAAVVARGGAGLLTGDPVQVWARAALFLQVRGLSEAMRAEHFEHLAGLA